MMVEGKGPKGGLGGMAAHVQHPQGQLIQTHTGPAEETAEATPGAAARVLMAGSPKWRCVTLPLACWRRGT